MNDKIVGFFEYLKLKLFEGDFKFTGSESFYIDYLIKLVFI